MECNISWCGIQDLQKTDVFLQIKEEHVFFREKMSKTHIMLWNDYFILLNVKYKEAII